MQNYASDAVDACTTGAMGQSQSPSRSSRPSLAAQHSKRGSEPINRSEAAASVDLSAASNMAAHGEDPMLHVHKLAEGVSAMGRSEPHYQSGNADQWYQDSNKNASTRGNVSFVDDDPPFHLPQQLPSDQTAQHLALRTTSATPGLPPSFLQQNSMQSSSSGEFRAVIDDLTVENKKLKRKLRTYERSHASHLHPDRMFEVRMSGLQGKDKQRLEKILKDFAESISGSDKAQQPKLLKHASKGSSKRPSSSATLNSASNQVDSAYASGAGSAGNASGSQSQRESRGTNTSDSTLTSSRGEQKGTNPKIQSYLQNISRGLLPQRPTAMTEKARKRVVVKRLEQLFTGRARTNAKNTQSAQQQEVSTAAANADKAASEAKGRPVQEEGIREAIILQGDAEAAMLQTDSSKGKTTDDTSPPSGISQKNPDQRPTRPLDLDLNRAQNPAENLAYIRHLGFKPLPAEASSDVSDDDGWVYLNLLMGMAQLHTVNVTPAFVRGAVKEASDKLELSENGSKLRWRGGTEGTQRTGDSGSDGNKTDTPPDGLVETTHGLKPQSPSRSRSSKPSASEQTTGAMKSSGGTNELSATKTGSRDISASTIPEDVSRLHGAPVKRPIYLGRTDGERSFHYQPMFSHGVDSDDDDDNMDEDDSLMSSGMREDTTGYGSNSQKPRSNGMVFRGRDDGPMIFYHQAQFVTDLSGDQGFTPVNNISYSRVCEQPADVESSRKLFLPCETKGELSMIVPTISTFAILTEDGSVQPPDDFPLLEIHDGRAPKLSTRYRPDPYPLPVSGLGGVVPAESLVFYPEHRQHISKRQRPVSSVESTYRKCASLARKRLLGNHKSLLDRIPGQDRLNVRLSGLGQVYHEELCPSELPPPSYAFMHLSSSGGDDSWNSDDESDSQPDSEDIAIEGNNLPDFAPPALMRTHEETSGDADVSSDNDEDMDDDDDGEVDMLAHERELNAEDVAAREREWEEGLREPSPYAPSSAATVGDRSFLSSDEEDAASQGKSVKRRGTHAGSKRGREEVDDGLPDQNSPAKKVETSQARAGAK